MKKTNFLFAALIFAALSLGFVSCENPDDDKFGNSTEQSDDNETPDAPDSGDDDSDTPSVVPDGAFSVSRGRYVVFSPGNLQYTQSTDTWSFAENQWDYIGTDNVTGGSGSSRSSEPENKEGTELADKIDLFGWSTSSTNFGVSTSRNNNDYSGSFVDWGINQIGSDAPNTWRTLTKDEWEYLCWERPNYDKLIGGAQVNGVNGLVLLPDSWTCSDGITFKSSLRDDDGYYVECYDACQFTADQWSKMEVAGAVFLPTAGYRGNYCDGWENCDGYGYDGGGIYGYSWSSTPYDSDDAWSLGFGFGGVGFGGSVFVSDIYRYDGLSVRLVQDL